MEKSCKLTPCSVDQLGFGKYADAESPGLYVEIQRSGQKKWIFRRRLTGSTTIIERRLGTYPAYSIAAARAWASGLNDAIERGEDPRIAMRHQEQLENMTIAKAHAIYMKAMRRGDRKTLRPRTIYDKEAIYRCDIEPRLGRQSLLKLTEDACWDAVYDKAKASKFRANKMAGELSCFLRWCSGREGRMAGIDLKAHPAPTLNSNWFQTGPQNNKRFLNADELALLLRALVHEEWAYRRGFALLLLTAARRNELFAARSEEFSEGLWTLPAERSKNGVTNYVALGPWARRLAQTNGEWMFPSSRIDGPQLGGWFKSRARVHQRMEAFAGGKIESWHFHDLRRTFRTHARRLGIDRDIAELMLNHKRKGVEAIYNKDEELELRADGFARWEHFIADIARRAGVADQLAVPLASVQVDPVEPGPSTALCRT